MEETRQTRLPVSELLKRCSQPEARHHFPSFSQVEDPCLIVQQPWALPEAATG